MEKMQRKNDTEKALYVDSLLERRSQAFHDLVPNLFEHLKSAENNLKANSSTNNKSSTDFVTAQHRKELLEKLVFACAGLSIEPDDCEINPKFFKLIKVFTQIHKLAFKLSESHQSIIDQFLELKVSATPKHGMYRNLDVQYALDLVPIISFLQHNKGEIQVIYSVYDYYIRLGKIDKKLENVLRKYEKSGNKAELLIEKFNSKLNQSAELSHTQPMTHTVFIKPLNFLLNRLQNTSSAYANNQIAAESGLNPYDFYTLIDFIELLLSKVNENQTLETYLASNLLNSTSVIESDIYKIYQIALASKITNLDQLDKKLKLYALRLQAVRNGFDYSASLNNFNADLEQIESLFLVQKNSLLKT